MSNYTTNFGILHQKKTLIFKEEEFVMPSQSSGSLFDPGARRQGLGSVSSQAQSSQDFLESGMLEAIPNSFIICYFCAILR